MIPCEPKSPSTTTAVIAEKQPGMSELAPVSGSVLESNAITTGTSEKTPLLESRAIPPLVFRAGQVGEIIGTVVVSRTQNEIMSERGSFL